MNRIKELRELHRMTQVRLSIELGVSQETVSAYEKGRYFPSYQSLVRLSELFHVSIDYLMGRTEERSEAHALGKQDELVLALFQNLDERGKEKALAYLQGLSER